jgi:hypothetical protein
VISIGDIVVVKRDFAQLKAGSEYYVFIGENPVSCIGIMSSTNGRICYWPSKFFDIASSRMDNAIKLKFCLEFAEKETGRNYNTQRPSWELSFKHTFDEFIEFASPTSLHRIFREVGDDVVIAVLWSCKTKEKVDKIKKSLSKNHFKRLLEDIENYGGVWNCQDLIDKFMKNVRMLEEMGEIIIAREDNDSIQVNEFCRVAKPISLENSLNQQERIMSSWNELHKKEREEIRAKKDKEVFDWKNLVGIE